MSCGLWWICGCECDASDVVRPNPGHFIVGGVDGFGGDGEGFGVEVNGGGA